MRSRETDPVKVYPVYCSADRVEAHCRLLSHKRGMHNYRGSMKLSEGLHDVWPYALQLLTATGRRFIIRDDTE